MHIDAIVQSLQRLNATAEKPAKPKKQTAKPTNGVTHLSDEENLRITLARAVAAFGLEEKGVTVEQLVAGVKNFEAPYQGVVQ